MPLDESCTPTKWIALFNANAQLTQQELAELAGYTARVSDLLDTMDEVKQGKYQKKLVSSSSVEDNKKSEPYRVSRVSDC